MSVDGENEVGIARDGYKAEAIARISIDHDDCQWSDWAVEEATSAINERSIWSRNESSRRSRDMIPVRERDNRVLVVNVISGASERHENQARTWYRTEDLQAEVRVVRIIDHHRSAESIAVLGRYDGMRINVYEGGVKRENIQKWE